MAEYEDSTADRTSAGNGHFGPPIIWLTKVHHTTKVYLYSTQRVKYLISAHFDDNTLKLLKTPNPVSQTSK